MKIGSLRMAVVAALVLSTWCGLIPARAAGPPGATIGPEVRTMQVSRRGFLVGAAAAALAPAAVRPVAAGEVPQELRTGASQDLFQLCRWQLNVSNGLWQPFHNRQYVATRSPWSLRVQCLFDPSHRRAVHDELWCRYSQGEFANVQASLPSVTFNGRGCLGEVIIVGPEDSGVSNFGKPLEPSILDRDDAQEWCRELALLEMEFRGLQSFHPTADLSESEFGLLWVQEGPDLLTTRCALPGVLTEEIIRARQRDRLLRSVTA